MFERNLSLPDDVKNSQDILNINDFLPTKKLIETQTEKLSQILNSHPLSA